MATITSYAWTGPTWTANEGWGMWYSDMDAAFQFRIYNLLDVLVYSQDIVKSSMAGGVVGDNEFRLRLTDIPGGLSNGMYRFRLYEGSTLKGTFNVTITL